MPKGAKVLKVLEQTKQHGESAGPSTKTWSAEIGMPWSEQEFFDEALEQKHPMEVEAHLPDRTKVAIMTILTEGVAVWAAHADHRLDELARDREKLAPLEEELKSKIPEQTRGVNEKKQTQLLKKVLEDMRYPDTEVAFKCLTGLPLIGDFDETGVFPTRNLEELNVGADPIWLARMAKQASEAQVQLRRT